MRAPPTFAAQMAQLDAEGARPAARLGFGDAVAMIVGIVVGAGIFRAPGVVAQGVDSVGGLIALWALGGVVSVVGALCYAELSTAFPDAGGEYHFLGRAYGQKVAFLFAWARLTVIPTGSIALLSFVFGDYLSELLPLCAHSNVLYAGLLVLSLTFINVLGLKFGTWVQNVFTALVVVGLLGLIVAGLFFGGAALDAVAPVETAAEGPPGGVNLGLAMVFVLLTYGGWNEAAYLSSEVRGGRRRVALALVAGVAAVTVLYVLANLAYVRALGLDGLKGSVAVASDIMRGVSGPVGTALLTALIAAAGAATGAAGAAGAATAAVGAPPGPPDGRCEGPCRRLSTGSMRWSRRS